MLLPSYFNCASCSRRTIVKGAGVSNSRQRSEAYIVTCVGTSRRWFPLCSHDRDSSPRNHFAFRRCEKATSLITVVMSGWNS